MKKTEIALGDTLLPSLVQCFGIIFLGYVLGKTKVLKQNQAQGISLFVQYLSLPSLIFVTVSTIPFTQVKWEFVASVFVAKSCIFICAALVTILLTQTHDLGKAGMFAIMATQSNDFALGFPLFNALYQNKHPEYPMYLYIIAPIQLLILNTIGFFLLENEKQTQESSRRGNYLYRVLKGTLQNPVVIMTIVGLIWNATYGQKVLPIFDEILKAFSSAFPATALFLVGYTMTNKSSSSNSHITLSVIILILTKNLIFPIILQKCSAFFLQNSSAGEIENYSSFGFLYGTLPTAPTVYVFATQYKTCIDTATKTIVGSTLFSIPLMFATASVISLTQVGIKNITSYLSLTISYLSIANLICCTWLMLIFFIGKRWKSVSFGVSFYLILAQFLTSIGGILLFFSPAQYSTLFYIQYILTVGSIYATRLCTWLLAALLLIIRIRSLCFVLQIKRQINILSVVVCFIIPYAIAASLMFFGSKGKYEPNCQLGFIQSVTSFIVSSVCFLGTIICLILQQIKRNHGNFIEDMNSSISYQNPDLCTHSSEPSSSKRTCCEDIEDIARIVQHENNPESGLITIDPYERLCDSRYPCSAAKRFQCSAQVSRYIDDNNEIGTGLLDDEYFLKHIILLVLFCVAMILSLSVNLWRFIKEPSNGIFTELEFLDVIINYISGILCYTVFGFEGRLLNLIRNKFKKNKFAPLDKTSNHESKEICEQFLIHHFENCRKDIEQTKIINCKEFNAVFYYSDLVAWLLEAEVAGDNAESEFLIECFLKAHIIEELAESYQGKCLYRFTDTKYLTN